MPVKRTSGPSDPVQLGKLMIDIMNGPVPNAADDGAASGEGVGGVSCDGPSRELSR